MIHHWLNSFPRSVKIFAAILILGLGGAGISSGLTDIDQDGYVSVSFGGDDCIDQISSVYQQNWTCDPIARPVFLETANDPDSDDDIVDHTWMRDISGLWHLYFQTEDQGLGDFLEHYTSTDLQTITRVGTALTQTPDGWDRYGLWAPHAVYNEQDGLYYLFYAGTTGAGGSPSTEQRIGVATSSDLTTWTKVPQNVCDGTTGDGCVYECDESWTQWGSGQAYAAQCRDPFVIHDEAQNRWLLFTTVRLNETVIGGPWTQGVSVASSTDLLHWSGLGYIAATKRLWSEEGGAGAQLSGGVAENPFVTVYDGNYYLFFTDYNDPEDSWTAPNPRSWTQYVSSPTLDSDTSGSANWTYRGYTREPGVNALEIQAVNADTWILSASIGGATTSGDNPVHFRDLRLKRMVWNTDGTFTVTNLTNLSCRLPSAAINPGVAEQCHDGLDNNCNAEVDDVAMCGICIDSDDDGYGSVDVPQCRYPGQDCHDSNPAIHPGATEICEDIVDNNCDGATDEPGCTLICLDADHDGYGVGGLAACAHPEADCNDANWWVHPGATEICADTIDNNCDDAVDELSCTEICIDDDGDGYGQSGFTACNFSTPDCNDQDETIFPGATEMCSDGIDNNCAAGVDEPLCVGVCLDNDNDTYGTSGLLSCQSQQLDCNDTRSNVYPGAAELCDVFDNNCNGQVNDGIICRNRKVRWTLCEIGWPGESGGGSCFVY